MRNRGFPVQSPRTVARNAFRKNQGVHQEWARCPPSAPEIIGSPSVCTVQAPGGERGMTIPRQFHRPAALRATAIALMVGALPATLFAQAWPTKPIRAIIPIAAGSAADVIPRTVFDHLSGQLGQTIVVENRPGAGGTIGAAAVAK